MKRKRSEEGAIIAYFSLRPLQEAEALYSIVTELVRVRRREGKPPTARKKKLSHAGGPETCLDFINCSPETHPAHWVDEKGMPLATPKKGRPSMPGSTLLS